MKLSGCDYIIQMRFFPHAWLTCVRQFDINLFCFPLVAVIFRCHPARLAVTVVSKN